MDEIKRCKDCKFVCTEYYSGTYCIMLNLTKFKEKTVFGFENRKSPNYDKVNAILDEARHGYHFDECRIDTKYLNPEGKCEFYKPKLLRKIVVLIVKLFKQVQLFFFTEEKK